MRGWLALVVLLALAGCAAAPGGSAPSSWYAPFSHDYQDRSGMRGGG